MEGRGGRRDQEGFTAGGFTASPIRLFYSRGFPHFFTTGLCVPEQTQLCFHSALTSVILASTDSSRSPIFTSLWYSIIGLPNAPTCVYKYCDTVFQSDCNNVYFN